MTSKTKMIVVTEAWVHCEIDITVFLQISFLFLVWLGLGLRLDLGIGIGLGLGWGNISSKDAQMKKLLYNGKDREQSHKSELKDCMYVCVYMWVCICVSVYVGVCI